MAAWDLAVSTRILRNCLKPAVPRETQLYHMAVLPDLSVLVGIFFIT